MQRTDQAQIGVAGLGRFHFENIGDTELRLAAANKRNQHGLAGGRLHHDIQAGLFFQHLGNRRS